MFISANQPAANTATNTTQPVAAASNEMSKAIFYISLTPDEKTPPLLSQKGNSEENKADCCDCVGSSITGAVGVAGLCCLVLL